MTRTLIKLHRWAGLVLGAWIALVALSGIGMVFSTTFWAWEYGEAQTHVDMRDAPYAALDKWLARAEARFGPLQDVEGFFLGRGQHRCAFRRRQLSIRRPAATNMAL